MQKVATLGLLLAIGSFTGCSQQPKETIKERGTIRVRLQPGPAQDLQRLVLFEAENGNTYKIANVSEDVALDPGGEYTAELDEEKNVAYLVPQEEPAPSVTAEVDDRKILVVNIKVRRANGELRESPCSGVEATNPRHHSAIYAGVRRSYNLTSNQKADWTHEYVDVVLDDAPGVLSCNLGTALLENPLGNALISRAIAKLGSMNFDYTDPQYVTTVFQLPLLGPDFGIHPNGFDCVMTNLVPNPLFDNPTNRLTSWTVEGGVTATGVPMSLEPGAATVGAAKLPSAGDALVSAPIAMAHPLLGSATDGGTDVFHHTSVEFRVANPGEAVTFQLYVRHGGTDRPIGPAKTATTTSFDPNAPHTAGFQPSQVGLPAEGKIVLKRISGTGTLYLRNLIVKPHAGFGWGGVGMFAGETFIRASACSNGGYISHEIGHTLSLMHASFGPGPQNEYADASCTMGVDGRLRNFNAPHLLSLRRSNGWQSAGDTDVEVISADGVYRKLVAPLYSANLPTGQKRTIEVRGASPDASNNVKAFFLSVRSASEEYGATLPANPPYLSNVNIHSATLSSSLGTVRSHTMLEKLAAVNVEESFVDNNNRPVKIKVLSRTADVAEVCIRIGTGVQSSCDSVGTTTGSTSGGTTSGGTATGGTATGGTATGGTATGGSTTGGTTTGGTTSGGTTGSTTGGTNLNSKNVALASEGAVASASSTTPGLSADLAIDGSQVWGTVGAWKDSTPNSDDWLQVDFQGSKQINKIVVYGVRDDYTNPAAPSDATPGSLYHLINFSVQYWTGSQWSQVPNANVVSNTLVKRTFSFPAIETSRIRVVMTSGAGGYSRIAELEAWTSGGTGGTTTGGATGGTVGGTAGGTSGGEANVASSAEGAEAFASSSFAGGINDPRLAIDGVLTYASSGTWKDATVGLWPDALEVRFNGGAKRIHRIVVYGVRDDFLTSADPTTQTVGTLYTLQKFNVQYWSGTAWVTVPNGAVDGNNKVMTVFQFPAVDTPKIRVEVLRAADGFSRIVELEAWASE